MAGSNAVQCIGPSYHLEDVKAACQSAINTFPQKLDGDDKWMMAASPGEVDHASVTGPVRASKNIAGRWFVVASTDLYEVHPLSGVLTLRGTLLTASGFVGMANNASQLAIVDGPNLYIFNLATNVLTQIVSAGWRGSDDVHELDGYFIFVAPGTEQFYISAIDDGTNLDALDFSSADSSPDNIIAHRVNHRQAWFLGDLSTEIWVDSGGAGFPFVRYQSYTLDVGVVGKRAAINAADTLFWIGKTTRGTGIVYMAVGNQPQRVSTLAVEKNLLSSTDLTQASMWTYQIEGHEFIGINAPGLDTTWVYDAAVKQWHERAEWDEGWLPLRSRLVTTVGVRYFGGTDDGKLVRLDSTLNTLSGRPLVRERTWPHLVAPGLEPVSFFGLELAMKTGAGGNVTLEISNDGGNTFGPKLLRALGATGRWMQRIRWLGLGTAFNRVFRIRCSDDAPWAIYAAAVET